MGPGLALLLIANESTSADVHGTMPASRSVSAFAFAWYSIQRRRFGSSL